MCLSKLSYTNKSLGVRYWGKKLIGQESSKGTTSGPSLHTSQLEKECKKIQVTPFPYLFVSLSVFLTSLWSILVS